MRISLAALLRRLRRQRSSALSSLGQLVLRAEAPRKHIKIDDEEQQFQAESFRSPGRPRLVVRATKMLLLILFVLLFLVVLIAYTIYKPPIFVIRFFQWKNPDVLFHVPLPASQRVLALTIDDAPSDQTAKILDLLKTYHAKATFFVIGSQVYSHEDLIQRMHDEGHETGNHAWEDEPSFKLPLSELERQIKEIESLLPENPNGAKYFRPGSGFFNKMMAARIAALEYRMVLGSVYPHDPQIRNAKVNAKHILSMVRPGSIVIMHDRRSYSAEQLELVLKGLTAEGWTVESLGGLLRIAERERGKKGG